MKHNFECNALAAVFLTGLCSCATVESPTKAVEAPVSRVEQQQAQVEMKKPDERVLKRKVAIGRFTNETRYGKSLLRDDELDPLGKQVADMLMARLVQSGKFLVFERNDLGRLEREQAIIAGQSGKRRPEIDIERGGENSEGAITGISARSDRYSDFKLVGVDALIIGSLTEFSRKNVGKSGFLSGTKKQVAEAKVEVRLADPLTGYAFFSASGAGSADAESGTVAGFGSKAGYDGSLNDKAIAAAISDLIGEIMTKLEGRPWRAGVLKVDGSRVFISGGERQGLKVGDTLNLMKKSETIQSDSGFDIELPPENVGTVKIVALFGDSETNEGSVAQVLTGNVGSVDGLFVSE